MKRLLIVIFFCLPMLLMAQNKVAIYVNSTSSNVDEALKEIIGSELVNAIVTTNKYLAVERTEEFLHQINTEQGYQRSGNVDEKQLSQLGKQFGVDYVCVANVMEYKDSYYVQARLIDVETAMVKASAREVSTLANVDEIVAAASRVAYALVGIQESSVKSATLPASPFQEGVTIYRRTYLERTEKGGNLSEYIYGKTEMDRKAMANFLRQNSPIAYHQYMKGEKILWSSYGVMSAGALMSIIGFACNGMVETRENNGYYYNSIENYSYSKDYHYDRATTLAIGIVGTCVTVISAAVMIPIGCGYRNNAYLVFNQEQKKAPLSLNLQASQNGIGLALNF